MFDFQGTVNFGSIASKRSLYMRKLDLPPKFASTLNSTHKGSSSLVHQQQQQQQSQPIQYSPSTVPVSTDGVSTGLVQTSNVMSLCSQPLNSTVAVALHPQVPAYVQQQQQVPTSVPLVPTLNSDASPDRSREDWSLGGAAGAVVAVA